MQSQENLPHFAELFFRFIRYTDSCNKAYSNSPGKDRSSSMNVLGNIFWLLLGGLVLGIMWALAGLLCCVTIIGIPFGVQCFKIAGLVLSPFGKEIEGGGGPGSCLMNVVWILLFGWELFLSSVAVGLVYCVTIVGIPLGLQSFKLARLALFPFGSAVV